MNMTMPYHPLQQNLTWTCDKVCYEHEPIPVAQGKGGGVVLLSEKDHASLVETAYLLRSPANVRRVTEAMRRPRSEQIEFADMHELKDAIGL